jgi:hypothetical protein
LERWLGDTFVVAALVEKKQSIETFSSGTSAAVVAVSVGEWEWHYSLQQSPSAVAGSSPKDTVEMGTHHHTHCSAVETAAHTY